MTDRIVTEPPHTQQPEVIRRTDSLPAKPPVSRGARACTVCRAAKMKCVGAEEDGMKPCQRCRRSNLECVFEKHRRGRKPGSKLSEASKMLRKLEKGLSSAKVKGQESSDMSPAQIPFPVSDSRSAPADPSFHPRYSPRELYVPSQRPRSSNTSPYAAHSAFPTLTAPYTARYSQPPSSGSHSMDEDEDDREDDTIYPANMVEREGRRHSFFGTILNPSDSKSASQKPQMPTPQPTAHSMPNRLESIAIPRLPNTTLEDPVSAGIIAEENVTCLFEMVFLRLNPFINLFDPVLHTPTYVRSRCPFLFTTLLMAGCKFWKPDRYKACQRLAEDFCIRAFQEGWKRVEVVQAFASMTYWKEPDDTRTWTFIGYACRMAVELGLNTYCSVAPAGESQQHRLERRNRERTYLVLWVHDRSLSMQTGRQWMLPEDDLVRNSTKWYEQSALLPVDIVVSAQVQLRRIAAEVTDVFYLHKGAVGALHADVNYEILLRGCNGKLNTWGNKWNDELKNAGGESFHFSLLHFFRLHVRLFLNSFGLQSSLLHNPQGTPSLSVLSVCYTSAMDTLKLVTEKFATIGMLRYGQDSITVMTAYSAVFLLKLLRSTSADVELGESVVKQAHELINSVGDAYQEAAKSMPSCSSVEYHGRFLRTLVVKDAAIRQRHAERDRKGGCEPEQRDVDHHQRNAARPAAHDTSPSSAARMTPPPSASVQYGRAAPAGQARLSVVTSGIQQPRPTHPPSAAGPYPNHAWHFPASPHLPAHPLVSPEGELNANVQTTGMQTNYPQPGSEQQLPDENNGYNPRLEVAYWYNIHADLGYGNGVNPTPAAPPYMGMPQAYPQISQPYNNPSNTIAAG